jgi:hypothetical protein
MARRKPNEQSDEPVNPGEQQAPQPEGQAAGAGENSDAQPAPKNKWAPRFGSWSDYEAGVHLTEDRQNKLMTIKFDAKPSEAVRKLMKEDYGYRFDPEDQLWYKQINRAKQRQTRAEADIWLSRLPT